MKPPKIWIFLLTAAMMLSLTAAAVFAEGFSDVPANHPYKAAIDKCQSLGFVKGTGADTFEPDAKLTRAQFAVLWCRTLHIKEQNPTFTDLTKLNYYYDNPAIVLYSLGVMNGLSATEFSPHSYVSREQLALLTMRTYMLAAEDPEAYKQYTDFASISEWARDGVSACIEEGLFAGLYDKQAFMPGEPVTRGEVCQLIYNLMEPLYEVTIGPLTGGTITASPTAAHAGTLISLTVTPDAGKRLKAGTLKYDDTAIEGTTFLMPEKDVTVTAEFEDKPVLESISITEEPAKTAYTVGEILDLSGLEVTAHYSDGTDAPVAEYTTEPAEGSTLDTEGTVTVTVSYTEEGVTKTADFSVTVNAPPDDSGG
jgi:hypothetical protein